MKLAMSALAVVLAISIPPGASAQSSTSQDAIEVAQVMKAFRQAIIAHDGKGLAATFIPDGGACFNMLSDEAYAVAIAKDPNTAKFRPEPCSDFVKFVSTTKDAIDETMDTNLQIHTDGTVATAHFDFVFLINGKAARHGLETWELVKGTDGWRITAITWSTYPVQ